MAQPVEGSAESSESIAVLGRRFTLYLMLAGPWQQARQLKGPTTAKYSVAGLTKERERLWRGERPIRVTVGSDAARDDRGGFEQLIALSSLDEVEVQVGPQLAGRALPPSVSVMSFVPSPYPTKFGLRTSAEPTTTWGVDLGSPEWPALAERVFSTASPEWPRTSTWSSKPTRASTAMFS